MANEEFMLNLPAPTEKLFKIVTDYEKYTRFFEGYLKSVKILENNSNDTKTEEVFFFKSLFSHEIVQISRHTTKKNYIHTEVIEGPFKGSVIETFFDETESGTRVTVKADYKIGLKYKIIGSIIKQKYRIIVTGLLYKMNAMAMNEL